MLFVVLLQAARSTQAVDLPSLVFIPVRTDLDPAVLPPMPLPSSSGPLPLHRDAEASAYLLCAASRYSPPTFDGSPDSSGGSTALLPATPATNMGETPFCQPHPQGRTSSRQSSGRLLTLAQLTAGGDELSPSVCPEAPALAPSDPLRQYTYLC